MADSLYKTRLATYDKDCGTDKAQGACYFLPKYFKTTKTGCGTKALRYMALRHCVHYKFTRRISILCVQLEILRFAQYDVINFPLQGLCRTKQSSELFCERYS